jgi:hypothetical protein
MADFPRSPQLLKGALAIYDRDQPSAAPRIVAFQYNPEQVRRTLANRAVPQDQQRGARAARQDVLRVAGPPVETLTLSVVLDAADQLAAPATNPTTTEDGLHPALAALELLMYPPSLGAEQLERQAAAGAVQVEPASLPLTLLVWGKSRVVPVTVTSFAIAEEAFDPRLNPIRAKVDLGLKVLTYVDFPGDAFGRDAFIAHQKQKESLAQAFASGGDQDQIRSYLPRRR